MELIGADKAIERYDRIAAQLDDPHEALRRELHVLEAAQAGAFAALHGRYVATGATMRSLTLPSAPHAIRRVEGGTVEFGTDIPYARYLTETIGPETPAGGMARPLPVAVLKLDEATRHEIAHDVLDAVTGEGASGLDGLGGAFIGGAL